jgi:hypothetical protein
VKRDGISLPSFLHVASASDPGATSMLREIFADIQRLERARVLHITPRRVKVHPSLLSGEARSSALLMRLQTPTRLRLSVQSDHQVNLQTGRAGLRKQS